MKAVSDLIPDDSPCDPVYIMCGLLHSFLCQVVELHDVLEHAHGLVEGAVAIVNSVGVLLEEVVLDQLGNLQNDFV